MDIIIRLIYVLLFMRNMPILMILRNCGACQWRRHCSNSLILPCLITWGEVNFHFFIFCQSYPLIKSLPTCWFSHSVSTTQLVVHILNFPSVYTPMFVPQFSRNSYFLLYLNIASKDILIVKKVLFKSAFLQKYLQ